MDYYLKDNEQLRKLNDARNKAKTAKDNAQHDFLTLRGNFDASFACVRALCLLVSKALSMYTGLYLDTTSLLPLGTDTVVPTTCKASASIHPFLFGGNSSASDGNVAQRETVVNSLLNDVPWTKLASVAHIEREVSGTIASRILAATACKLSDSLQCKLAPWAYRALYDLTHQHRWISRPLNICNNISLPCGFIYVCRWYPVKEDIPDPDAPPSPRGDRELFRSLSVEEPAPPRFLFFSRTTTLDTRISTCLAFWCNRGNFAVSRACSYWKAPDSEAPDTDACLWTEILTGAKQKSEIVDDEAAYYEIVDPSRTFREMDLRNTATKLEELDEETSCSESESDSGDEGQSDDDSGDPDEEGLGLFGDSIPLIPPHNRVFDNMISDKYAMAVLHQSATEVPDDNLDDFDLFKDSRSISTE